jgi:hypothetical protein
LRRFAPLAARVLGYVDDWFRREQRIRLYTEQRSYEILLASLQEQLSTEHIAFYPLEGSSMSLDEAT